MTKLAGAHVVITGGSSGIGLATARWPSHAGARVSLIARDPGGSPPRQPTSGATADRVGRRRATPTRCGAAFGAVVERGAARATC